MSGINRWQGIMNLGAEPELRFTQAGKAVLNMRGACTEKYKDREGTEKEVVTWIPCVVWGPRGEGLAKVLKKGDRLYIEGSLRVSSYDDKEGVKRTKFEIDVRELEFAGGGKGASDGQEQPARDIAPRGNGSGAGNYNRGGGFAGRPAAARPATTPGPPEEGGADDYSGGYGGSGGDDLPF